MQLATLLTRGCTLAFPGAFQVKEEEEEAEEIRQEMERKREK